MKKKILFVLFFFASTLVANAVTIKGHLKSFGVNIINGINYEFHKYTYSDGTIKYLAVVNSKEGGYSGDIQIPDIVHAKVGLEPASGNVITDESVEEDFTVVGIKGKAFMNCTNLLSIRYTDSLETIGDSAFEGCTSLSYFGRVTWNMGGHIKSIGKRGFFGCSELPCINIGDSIEKIDVQTFEGCTSLTEVMIYPNLSRIDSRAFAGCTSLTTIFIMGIEEKKLEIIESEAFLGCSSLESFKIPYSVKGMGVGAFKNCTGLKTVELSLKMTYLNPETFMGCTSLSQVLNTDNLTLLGGSVFEGCTNLKEFIIPNGLINIYSDNFRGTGLEFAEFPEGTEIIHGGAFHGCEHLKYVKIPSTVKQFDGGGAFEGCDSISTIKSEIKNPFGIFNDLKHFEDKTYNTATLIVPKGTIGDYKVAKVWKFFKNIIEDDSEKDVKEGDLTGDSEVNGTDLVQLVNYVLQGNNSEAADLNGDGVVNGTDLVALVNIIMNNGSANARKAMTRSNDISNTRVSIEPLYIGAGESREMTISLSNPDMDVTMIQLDMALPKGLRLKRTSEFFEYELADRTSNNKHSAYIRDNGDFTRLLIASGTNAILDGNEGGVIRLTLTADDDFEGGNIEFRNMLCTSPDLQEARPQNFTAYISGNTTGIHEIGTEDKGGSIYNLSGQRLKATHKGLNIVNGKKMVVR